MPAFWPRHDTDMDFFGKMRISLAGEPNNLKSLVLPVKRWPP
jgi:hypothetical protein